MKKSTIPVTFDENDGVNLPMFQPVLFTPGQNMWGLDPEGVYEGIYVGWNRPQFSALEIKIDYKTHTRFTPPIENVWRIWDARDDEIEALRKELGRTRAELRPLMTPEDWFIFEKDRIPEHQRRALMYGDFEIKPEGDPD
jgi:hypothetical protein